MPPALIKNFIDLAMTGKRKIQKAAFVVDIRGGQFFGDLKEVCLLYTSTEKSSKLMESMLVAVKPAAIILGKLLAITLTGIIQLFSWIFGLAISFFIGSKIVLSINPDTDMMIIQGFKMLGNMAEGILSPANCIMALLMIMTGMLLYCALAGAGGAMASKAEDLSSANAIFSLVLEMCIRDR